MTPMVYVAFEATSCRYLVTDREVFVVGNGWTNLRELKVGDRVAVGNTWAPRASWKVTAIGPEQAPA